jgi:hypothetical protein
MRKIPTIFLRDWTDDPRYVTPEPNPECKWVFDGEGRATRKHDGTCVQFDGSAWWARFQVKKGKPAPAGFVPIDTDAETGITVGWEPMDNSGFAKYHRYALRTMDELFVGSKVALWRPGTYELMGPGVSGRDEDTFYYHLVEHSGARWMDVPSVLTFETLKPYVLAAAKNGVEGVVWHHPDGRMAKIKARDFPRG